MSTKSGVASQVISLPSGGGALQGIGETFGPDLFTGTGQASVPIALPAGRAGMDPKLSLQYSTGNGNGPFGLGWNLDVPGVSRRTDRGVPRYRDQSADPAEHDTFVLSGSEELVPIAPGPVARFRPRTEGQFARIERDRTQGTDVWRVSGRDGLVSVFGTPGAAGADPAAVSDPAGRGRVACWMLSQTVDPFGNRVEYEYLRDRDQLYLRQLRYVDHVAGGRTRFLVTVTFVYEPRPDAFSTRRAGFEVRTGLRCRRIEVRTHADTDDGILARSYELEYSQAPHTGISLLSRVRAVGHDGATRQEMPPLEFGYSRFDVTTRRLVTLAAPGNTMPTRSLAAGDLELVDLFGNGLPDIIQLNGTARFWRNQGGGRFDAPQTMPEVPAGVHLPDPGVQLGDLNGNGRADLLASSLSGYFPLSFQGRWSPEGFVRYQQLPATNLDAPDTRMVDLTGDGVVDALRTSTEFELYFNDPVAGWTRVERRPRGPLAEFPDVSFTDARGNWPT